MKPKHAHCLCHCCVLPECVANGSRFTSGVWGWRRVRSTPLLRPQPSASVDNRRQPSASARDEVAMAVPMASSAKVVTFGGFKRRIASFHVAGVVLCDILTCVIMCRKVFCVAGALHTFPLHFALDTPHSTHYTPHSTLYIKL